MFVNMKKHGAKPPVIHPEGLEVHILEVSWRRVPLAYLEMKRWLLARRAGTRAIIFSGVPSYLLVPFVGRWGVPIFGDVHGAYEEMAEYGQYPKAMNATLVRLFNRWEASVTPHLTARLVVSHALREHSRRMHGDVPYFVIPCGVKEVCDNVMERRRAWRERLGWQGKTVWTYCGGLSPWQLVDRVIDQFTEYQGGDGDLLWMITPDADKAKAKCLASGIRNERFRCETLSPSEVEERLAAGDIGFLLRDDNVTNRVAFPNKFAQYVNAGLLTVLTKGLAEPAALSTRYGVSVVLDSPTASLAEQPWREALFGALRRRAAKLDAFHAACHELVRNHLLYSRTIQPLIDKI